MLDLEAIFNPDAIEAAVRKRYGPHERPVALAGLVKGPQDLPMDWRIWFEERAAIREYLGGLTRRQAEEAAMTETVQEMEAAKKKT